MKHSENKDLTTVLDSLVAVADLLHWADNEGRERMQDKEINGLYYYPGYVEFLNRWGTSGLPGLIEESREWDYRNGDLSTLKIVPRFEWAWAIMRECENDFFKENQERADNKLGPTQDFVSLYRSISRYLSGPGIKGSWDIDSWDYIFREKLQEWRDQANGWFPDLNDQVNDQGPADRAVTSTPATITIDREKLIECFTGGFKIPDRITGVVSFDGFHNEFVRRATTYTTTDIGRVAHQVRQSKWAVARVKRMNFSKWLRAFCEMCGVAVPADTSPSRYNKKTPATDFSAWLE